MRARLRSCARRTAITKGGPGIRGPDDFVEHLHAAKVRIGLMPRVVQEPDRAIDILRESAMTGSAPGWVAGDDRIGGIARECCRRRSGACDAFGVARVDESAAVEEVVILPA